MQALYDFLPVLAFFITLNLADVYVATGVLMAATVLVAAVQWLRTRHVSMMLLVSAGLALVFGGLTLYFHNELFIKWKLTVLNVLFAIVLLASQVLGGKPLMQRLMEPQIQADARTWRLMNTGWALFSLVIAAVNLVFVYHVSTLAWAKWKLAAIGLTVLYAFASSFWLAERIEHRGG